MARPIQYDPDKVLSDAVQLFWEKGYESTSIQDIVTATGLKPGSLYKVYSNKEELFHAVLDAYSNHYLEHVENLFNQGDDPLQNIETFLKQVIMVNITNEKTSGCLLIKTQLVISPEDKIIQHYIDNYFSQIELLLKVAITKAKLQGHTSVDPEHFSKFIITMIYGAHVFYKSNQDTRLLENNINYLLTALREPIP